MLGTKAKMSRTASRHSVSCWLPPNQGDRVVLVKMNYDKVRPRLA